MTRQIPVFINSLLATSLLLINVFCWFLLPILGQQHSIWFIIWLPVLLTTNTLWALIHEAIHTMLHPQSRISNLMGRSLALSLGIGFHLARFGHLTHHRFNRQGIDLTEGYDPAKTPKWLASIRYYLQITLGLYLSEILLPLLFLLPKSLIIKLADKLVDNRYRDNFKQRLLKQSVLAEIRIDALLMLSIWLTSFYLYGQYGWILLLAGLGRGLLISFADNLPHYDTPVDDVRYAYNLKLPKPLQLWLLNFNLHRVHHHYPNVPWRQLPDQFVQSRDKLDRNYFSQALNQLKGVIPISVLAAKNKNTLLKD
jgi:fatty acid desaturase